jgi:flagellar assembly factor FliW
VNITTTRFGRITVSPEELITMPQGLVGFPSLTRFAIIEPEEEGNVFRWWQSVDTPEAAFVVLNPAPLVADYARGDLGPEWAELGANTPDLRQLVVVVTAPGPGLDSVTLNLAAPILINIATRHGRQVVLGDDRYGVAVRLDEAAFHKSVELAA